MTIEQLFLLFIIYSFLGWIVEIIDIYILYGKIVNRGFLIGPYCPIYGVGALIITFVLTEYKYDLLVLFVMSMFFCHFAIKNAFLLATLFVFSYICRHRIIL